MASAPKKRGLLGERSHASHAKTRSLPITICGTPGVVERAEEHRLCDPASEFLKGGSWRSRAKKIRIEYIGKKSVDENNKRTLLFYLE